MAFLMISSVLIQDSGITRFTFVRIRELSVSIMTGMLITLLVNFLVFLCSFLCFCNDFSAGRVTIWCFFETVAAIAFIHSARQCRVDSFLICMTNVDGIVRARSSPKVPSPV